MFLLTMLFFFLQSNAATLAPIVIPVVVFLLAIASAYGFDLSAARTRTVIGATAGLYGAVGPLVTSYTSLPGWLRVGFIIIGIAAAATGERIQGGLSKVAGLGLLCLLLTSCGPGLIPAFRAAFAGEKVFVSSLVVAGKISQEKADLVNTDIGEGIDGFASCQQTIDAIPKDMPKRDRQLQKAAAYLQLAKSLRAILERHNLGGSKELDEVATIVQGAIDAFEAYYGGVTNAPGVTAGIAGAVVETQSVNKEADKALDAAMSEALKKMKALAKGQQ